MCAHDLGSRTTRTRHSAVARRLDYIALDFPRVVNFAAGARAAELDAPCLDCLSSLLNRLTTESFLQE